MDLPERAGVRWTTDSILAGLKRRHRRRAALSWRALAIQDRPLLSAAVYHFRSLKKAIIAAGLDYGTVVRRPQWTKERVIRAIKAARRKGRDLSWGAVTRRPGPLRRAAFAATRLFNGWARALQVAGVDVDDWRRYQHWDKTAVALDLRQRQANGDPMNSGRVQIDDPALHAAAIRYYKSFDAALRAAKVDPGKVRVRRRKG